MQVGKKYPSRSCAHEEVTTGNSQGKWASNGSDSKKIGSGLQIAVTTPLKSNQDVQRGFSPRRTPKGQKFIREPIRVGATSGCVKHRAHLPIASSLRPGGAYDPEGSSLLHLLLITFVSLVSFADFVDLSSV